jgi:hypothetical protein
MRRSAGDLRIVRERLTATLISIGLTRRSYFILPNGQHVCCLTGRRIPLR